MRFYSVITAKLEHRTPSPRIATELRPRAETWSGVRMAGKKAEKEKMEWQAAMEAMEKRLLDNMKLMFQDCKQETAKLIKEVQSDIGTMQKEMSEMKQEIHTSMKKVEKVEQDTKYLYTSVKELHASTSKVQTHLNVVDYKISQTHLRFRGIPEQTGMDDFEYVVGLVADFLDEEPDELKDSFDLIYRVNSEYARKRNLPRDVVVQLMTKRLTETILRKHFREPMKVGDTTIKIMRDLPRQVLKDRQKYRPLTDKLKKKNIRFRWEIPEGLCFEYLGQRIRIKDLDDMAQFLQDFEDDFADEKLRDKMAEKDKSDKKQVQEQEDTDK